MTYQHALRYLTAPHPTGAPHLPTRTLQSLLHKDAANPIFVCIPHHKQTSAAAQYLRSVLLQADIGCLHLTDTQDCQARDAFLLNGAPIPPTVLCPNAHAVHAMELSLRRAVQPSNDQATPPAVFPSAQRCAAVLLRCAQSHNCRVVLFEGSPNSPLLRASAELLGPISAIALVAATNDDEQITFAHLPFVKQLISHACGPVMYRTLSDACAHNGSRLILIAKTNMHRRSISLGAQTLDYGEFKNCRLSCGSALAADAAVLAIEAILTLRRGGLTICNQAVQQGLSRTVLPHCCSLSSIQPLLLTDRAVNADELSLVFRDLAELQAALPSPRRLWLDPKLHQAFQAHVSFADELFDDRTPLSTRQGTTTILIGSDAFLRHMLTNSPKKTK